ncbi:hypothetical protein [Burkholderia metallica]|uniref:Uncharacterized protein n=1 Tax=Burkholderia metallica TaxID=488729 RepID=A0ABT8PHM4_9BURK|nr:hypothetical protein [Burkholderia metallica]MCA8002747.1 hypothetical protein [Burkholderia metallica]MDN7934645.1 hypothetical protein [Burkholderia metallica]
MDQLNAPRIANNTDDLKDMLWHLSEWCAAQVNSPALGGDRNAAKRDLLMSIGGQLQALHADISFGR